jgi:hypothetical protein
LIVNKLILVNIPEKHVGCQGFVIIAHLIKLVICLLLAFHLSEASLLLQISRLKTELI